MRMATPQIATHLLSDPLRYLTPIGAFLRKTSLDELPQLFSVVLGDLSLVGPRPALFNQHDLIELRTQRGVDGLVPGITGWAQINGRDELPIPIKVDFDCEYLQRRSFAFDLKILLMTPKKVALCEGVFHQGIGATSDTRKIWENRKIRGKLSSQRIWFVSELYYPEMTSTGYFMTGIAEGVACEYHVSVLCSRPTYLARGAETRSHEIVKGVHIHRCWGTTFDKNKLPFKIVNSFTIATSLFVSALLRVHSKDIVIVVTNPPVLPYLIAVVCKLKGARFIVRVDDVYPELLTRFGFLKSGSIAERVLDSASRWLYRVSDRIIVLGRDVRDLATQKIAEVPSKIHIITHWGDTTAVRPQPFAKTQLVSNLNLSSHFVVQYCGNIGRTHGIEDFIEAATLLAENERFHFLMIGWGAKKEWALKQKLERSLRNLTILNPLPADQFCDGLNSCSVAIISFAPRMLGISVPSRMYNVLAAGKPILAVCDASSELAMVIQEEGVGWVVPPGRPDLIISCLRDAEANSDQLREMGQRARQAAVVKYPKDKVIESYKMILKELTTE